MNKRQELFLSILEKAAEDPDFRNSLLSDAKAAISEEFDVTVPDGLNIVVHENDRNTVHLPLPAKPRILGEGELRQVSGGEGVACFCYG